MKSVTDTHDHTTHEHHHDQPASAPLGTIGKLIGNPLAAIGGWLSGQHEAKRQEQFEWPEYTLRPLGGTRPKLAFDKGEESLMLSIVDQLFRDSDAAALGLMDFVAQQEGPNSWRARRHLVSLLQWTQPTPAQMAASKTTLEEASHSGNLEALFTAEVSQREIDFKRYIHQDPAVDMKFLMSRLDDLAYGLAARQSRRRQASVRVMLADLSLHLGHYEVANQQMASALALLGQLYENKELLELASEAYPGVVDITEPRIEAGSHQLHQGQ